MGRAPCCDEDAGDIKKGPWAQEEDERLRGYIERHGGHGSWRKLPKLAGLKRCSKSCRLRWTNYLRPDIKRGQFTDDEEKQIIELHAAFGNKWSAIALRLDRRTDNEIKNYWNTHLRKKLIHMGIDPVTHRPRPDLKLLASLPTLLAAANLTALAAPLDNVLRMQADAAELATRQLFANMVQLLIGSSSTPPPPTNMEANYTFPNQLQHISDLTSIMNQHLSHGPGGGGGGGALGLGLSSPDLLLQALVSQAMPQAPFELPSTTTSYPYFMVPPMDGLACSFSSDGASASGTDLTDTSAPSIASASPEKVSGGQMTQLFGSSKAAYESFEGVGFDELSDDFFPEEILNQV